MTSYFHKRKFPTQPREEKISNDHLVKMWSKIRTNQKVLFCHQPPTPVPASTQKVIILIKLSPQKYQNTKNIQLSDSKTPCEHFNKHKYGNPNGDTTEKINLN